MDLVLMRVIKRILRRVLMGVNLPGGTDSQRGFLLLTSIIVMVAGSLIILGLLSFTNVSLRVTDSSLGNAEEYYTADAEVMAVLADVVQGTDISDTGYTKPSVVLNNNSANVSISAASPSSGPSVQYRYFDPRASGNLTPLAAGAHYTFQLDNVVAESDFQINWAFTPADKSWKLTLYEGAGTGGSVIATDNLTLSPGYLSVDGSLIASGAYTVDFHNISDVSTSSASFNTAGGSEYTWIYTRAKKDYRVSATSGNTTINVYIRQEPGATVSPNAAPTVTIISWQAPAVTP